MPNRPVFRLVGREPSASQDVEAEIAFHLAEVTDQLVAEGWEVAAAREEARRRFGDVERVRRHLREGGEQRRRRLHWRDRLHGLWRDGVYAIRSLRRAPGFTLIVVLTLGLAIGANATMFGVVDRLLLRPPDQIPNAESIRRVTVARWMDNGLSEPWDAISFPAFQDLRDGTPSFAGVAAVGPGSMSLGLGPEARPVRAEFVTGQYFPMLGTRPHIGRFFGEEEDRSPDGTPVVVISWDLWRNGFGTRPDVLGEALRLDGHPFEVIGVAPRGFTGTNLEPVDVWVPFHSVARHRFGPGDAWMTHRGRQFLNAYVRLRDGASEATAAAEATRAYQLGHDETRVYEQRAVPYLGSLIAARTPGATAGTEAQVAAWLLGVTAIVLLIACANVANLVLARGTRRRSEVAVRLALGSSRGRLLRMLAAESLVLALGGAALGLLLARWGGDLLRATLLPGIAWDRSGLDGRVLAVTAAVTIFAAVVAGLLPWLRASRTDLAAMLHGASRQIGGAPLRLRVGLLLVQTTLCTALLVGAGLFVRSLNQVGGIDLGLQLDRALLVTVNLGAVDVPPEERREFYRAARTRLTEMPGVAAVGAMTGAPFRGNFAEGIRVPGRDTLPRLAGGGPYYFRVTPGALEALGVRLVRGRLFTDQDRAGTQPVAVISERMASLLWPGEDAVGRCFFAGAEGQPCREVVGIIGEIHRQAIVEEPFMLYFTVADQWAEPIPPNYLVIASSAGRPDLLIEPVRRELQLVRADLPFVNARPYREVVTPQLRSWQLGARMFTLFAGLSLVMAAVGLYGVLSYLVAQRTAELGIRAALGAPPRALLRLVLRSGLATAALGVVLGLGLVIVAGGRLEELLFRTSAREPAVMLLAGMVVVSVSLAASLVPGLRATRVDPMTALRAE